tara:strand:+ start:3661 stop:3918 length:258 start_codon:yes stop_codon:yes gene_type:complete
MNKEDLKNKIIYRASYRGTKEMDILMLGFVKSIINDINEDYLEALDKFVNMNDETLISIKNNDFFFDKKDQIMFEISLKFQNFQM